MGVGVLYADNLLAIVDKPSGLASQAGRTGSGLIEAIWALGFDQAALHHRLDQPASGALALALHPDANAGLAAAFRQHTAQRIYRAVLQRPVGEVTWSAPLDGQTARTHVHTVADASGLAAVEVTLETGRTHQIRKHAALAGAPILGDRRYGAEVGNAWPRLALHAWRLRVPHPVTGYTIRVTAPLPGDLVALWQITGAPNP